MDDESRGRIKPEADPRLSRSMEFGLAILECFSEERPSLGIADIATLVGISRSTTHRYATTLVVLGYLEQNSKRKYRLARRAAEAGVAATGALRLRVGALPVLEWLREQTGHTVSMGVLDGGRALYVQRLLSHREGQYEVDRHVGVGVPLPLHCTAVGKALLAGLSESDRDRTLREIELTPHAPNTILSRRGLLDELKRVCREGFAISDEEYVEGARSIAVLVDGALIEQRLAIEVTVPAEAYTVQELIADVGPRLRQAAKLISND
jgi:IclR family pca regulon transcriptional regulator